jgi:hypothetical protein
MKTILLSPLAAVDSRANDGSTSADMSLPMTAARAATYVATAPAD